MSISSPYHDQFCHYIFSNIFFSLLIVSPIEDVCPQYIVWSSFLSSPSGSGSGRNLDDLLRGGEKVIVRLLQEIPLVGEWLECGGVVGVKWL